VWIFFAKKYPHKISYTYYQVEALLRRLRTFLGGGPYTRRAMSSTAAITSLSTGFSWNFRGLPHNEASSQQFF
jgi:hypothetical protein